LDSFYNDALDFYKIMTFKTTSQMKIEFHIHLT